MLLIYFIKWCFICDKWCIHNFGENIDDHLERRHGIPTNNNYNILDEYFKNDFTFVCIKSMHKSPAKRHILLDSKYSSKWLRKNIKQKHISGFIIENIAIEELTPLDSILSTVPILSGAHDYNTYLITGKQSGITVIDVDPR